MQWAEQVQRFIGMDFCSTKHLGWMAFHLSRNVRLISRQHSVTLSKLLRRERSGGTGEHLFCVQCSSKKRHFIIFYYFLTSHSGHHKTNGEFGAAIVRRPIEEEIHKDQYDEDLPEHLIVISDWMDDDAEMHVPGLRQSKHGISPDNLLINGRGIRRRAPSLVAEVQTPVEVFRIRKGQRYRFRLINAMSHVCPTSIEVEKHSMRVLASDSFDLQPVTVESLISNSGERYDFVIDADENSGRFWIRVQGMGPCATREMEQFAILAYDEFSPLEDLAFNYPTPPVSSEHLNPNPRVSIKNMFKRFVQYFIKSFIPTETQRSSHKMRLS